MIRIGGSVVKAYKDMAEWFELVEELTYSTLVYPFELGQLDEGELEIFKRSLEEKNLTIAEVGIWNNPLDKDDDKKALAVQVCKDKLVLADQLGAKSCVNISGAKGGIWDGLYEENYDKATYWELVETIQDIIDSTNPEKTYYTIECMPWMIPDSPDQYLQLIQDVDRKAFGVHLDFVNMINSPERYAKRQAFIEQCFHKLGKYIKSIHIKDIKRLQGFPIHLQECNPGDGDIDFAKVLTLCNQLEGDVSLIVEHMSTHAEYKEAVAFLRKVADECGIDIL